MNKRLLALLLSVLMIATAVPTVSVMAKIEKKDAPVANPFTQTDAEDTKGGFELSLNGVWQVADWAETDINSINNSPYLPTQSIEGIPAFEKTAEVPSDIYGMKGFEKSSRVVYKTSFNIDSADSNYYLDFDGTNWIASVFVNGTYIGYKKGSRMPWKLDISNAVKAGSNDLVVVVKSPKYAIDVPGTIQTNGKALALVDGKATTTFAQMTKLSDYMPIDWPDCTGTISSENVTNYDNMCFIAPITVTSKGDAIGTAFGITDDVKLVCEGEAKGPYVTDAFVKTDVCDEKFQITPTSKKISVQATLYNPTDSEKTVSIAPTVRTVALDIDKDGIYQGKTYGNAESISGLIAQNVTIPAKSEKTVDLYKDVQWPTAKLWWPDCSESTAQMYDLELAVSESSKKLGVYDRQFGFRDVKIDGVHIRVNGVIRKFWNALGALSGTPDKMLENFKSSFNRFERFGYDLGLERTLTPFYKKTPSTEEQIQWCDFMGVPLRVCSMIDGMGADYAMYIHENEALGVKPSVNTRMFENFQEHLQDMAIQRRNHPSNIVYSVENELMFINAALIYKQNMKDIEAACQKYMVDPVHALDPTRPLMFDGGGAGIDNQYEIYCHHYLEEQNIIKNSESLVGNKSQGFWKYDGKRPYAGGEVAYFSGDFDTHCWIGGADAGNSYTDCTNAYSKYMKMLYNKYRWNDVAMTCTWLSAAASALAHPALHPLAVIRENYTTTFFASKGAKYKIKAFNDTFSNGLINVKWSLLNDKGEAVQQGSFDNQAIEPGTGKEFEIVIAPITGITEKTDYSLRLESSQADSKGADNTTFEKVSAFSEDTALSAFTKQSKTSVKKTVYAYNTSKAVDNYLKSIGVKVKKINSYYKKTTKKLVKKKGKVVYVKKKIKKKGKVRIKKVKKYKKVVQKIRLAPKTYKQKKFFHKKKQIVIVGRHGYKTSDTAYGDAAAVTRYARDGGRVIVLEQTVDHMYYSEADNKNQLPIKLNISMDAPVTANFTFGQGFDRPILKGLEAKDLSMWNGTGKTTENLWGTPTGSVRSWVKAGSKMCQAALLEVPAEKGLMLLTQLRVGAKINTEPVAQTILKNMLEYSVSYKLNSSKVGVLSTATDNLKEKIASVKVKTVTIDNLEAGLDLTKTPILIVEATEANLAALNSVKAKVDEYTNNGGWIMFTSLTDDAKALAQYNQLLGTQHMVRPFRKEAAIAKSDWTTIGLSTSDYQLFTKEIIAPWANKAAVSQNTWTYCVDATDNIAPFFDFEKLNYGTKYQAVTSTTTTGVRRGYDRNASTVVDGLYDSDFWHYIWQIWVKEANFPTETNPLTFDSLLGSEFTLPREEAIKDVVIYNNNNYETFKDASVTIGDKTVTKTLDNIDNREVSYDMGGTKGAHVDIKFLNFFNSDTIAERMRQETNAEGALVDGTLFGIDEIKINRVTPQWYTDAHVVPLNSCGSLVKYERDKGGFILNNLNLTTDKNKGLYPTELSTSINKKLNVVSTILYNIGAVFK